MGEAGDPLVLGGTEATHHTAQTSRGSRVLFATKPCDQVNLYPPAPLRSSPVLAGLQPSHELASQRVNCCMNAGWELGLQRTGSIFRPYLLTPSCELWDPSMGPKPQHNLQVSSFFGLLGATSSSPQDSAMA